MEQSGFIECDCKISPQKDDISMQIHHFVTNVLWRWGVTAALAQPIIKSFAKMPVFSSLISKI